MIWRGKLVRVGGRGNPEFRQGIFHAFFMSCPQLPQQSVNIFDKSVNNNDLHVKSIHHCIDKFAA